MAKMEKDKKTNNDLQRTTQETKDWPTQTPQKAEVCSGRVSVSCFTSDTHRVSLVKNLVIRQEWGKFVTIYDTQIFRMWQT